jgi:hypothetical protein
MHYWIHRLLNLLKVPFRTKGQIEHSSEEPAASGIPVQLPIEPLDSGQPKQLTLCDIEPSEMQSDAGSRKQSEKTSGEQSKQFGEQTRQPSAGSPAEPSIAQSKPAKEPRKRTKEPAKPSKKADSRKPKKKAADTKISTTVPKRVVKPKGSPLEVATAYIEENNYPAALTLLDDIIANDPKNTDALYKRAKVMELLGKTFEAIGDYTALIKAGYVSAEVYSARSKLFYKLGDEAQAMRDRQQAKDIYLRTMSEMQL